MSTENLKVVITGDASDLDKAGAEAQRALDGVSKSAAEWDKRARELNQQMNYTDRGLQKIGTTAAKIPPVANHVEQGFRRMSGATNQANFAMISLSQGIGDIPYGFTAIANNIQQTVQGFTYLQRTTGSTGGTLKALAKTLTGPTGLFIGFSVVTAIITGLINKYGSLSNAATALFGHLTDQEKAQKNLNDAIKDSSKTIQSNIEGLLKVKSTVDLAAGGYVSAKTAISQFNKELGSAFGDVNSLAQAQDKLNASSQGYIQATIYKTVATKLFSKAAKEVTDNIELQAKSNSDAATGIEKTINFLKAGFNFKNTSWDAVFKQMDQLNDKSGAAEKRLSQLTTQNDFGKLTKQAQGFLQTAAKIAKQFDVGIFGEGDAGGKGGKSITSIMQQLAKDFASTDTLAKGLGLSLEQIGTSKIEALYKAIENIAKIGGPEAVAQIKKLAEEANGIQASSFLPTLSGGRAQVNVPSGVGNNPGVPTYISPQIPKDVTNGIKTNAGETQNWAKAANELNNAFEGIFSSIAQGENPFQALIQVIEQLIIKLLAAAAAAAILNALTGGASAGFGAIFGQLSGLKGLIPSHAQGGYIPGPQLAIVGDAPGGEWVLNQRQISAILNGSGSGRNIEVTGRIEAEGSTLQVILDNANKKTNRRN